ncbi:MAG: hypothetical protein Q7K42_04185 [Candidatus Diapherotrites archaeon]|nr:hypothetical protein [Candidatus Diapherotrites archaeon]
MPLKPRVRKFRAKGFSKANEMRKLVLDAEIVIEKAKVDGLSGGQLAAHLAELIGNTHIRFVKRVYGRERMKILNARSKEKAVEMKPIEVKDLDSMATKLLRDKRYDEVFELLSSADERLKLFEFLGSPAMQKYPDRGKKIVWNKRVAAMFFMESDLTNEATFPKNKRFNQKKGIVCLQRAIALLGAMKTSEADKEARKLERSIEQLLREE